MMIERMLYRLLCCSFLFTLSMQSDDDAEIQRYKNSRCMGSTPVRLRPVWILRVMLA